MSSDLLVWYVCQRYWQTQADPPSNLKMKAIVDSESELMASGSVVAPSCDSAAVGQLSDIVPRPSGCTMGAYARITARWLFACDSL